MTAAPALEVIDDHVAHGPDGIVHVVKAVPPGTIGPDGYHQIWWMPTCQTLCGKRGIYPSMAWNVVATWHKPEPVTCQRCLEKLGQQEFDW